MEENAPSEIEDSILMSNPKLLRDLIKLKQLQIKIDDGKSSKQSINDNKGKFRVKHFFMYIFPALIQIGTLYAAYLAIVKSRFFEAANYYAEARNINLKNEEDSLKSHKSRLHDSIANYTLQIKSQKAQLQTYTNENTKLNSANGILSKTITNKNNSIKKLNAGIIDNYSMSFAYLKNKPLETLISQSRQSVEDATLIKKYIDNNLNQKIDDTASNLANKIKLSALGYFCFKSQVYRDIFIRTLRSTVKFYTLNFNDDEMPNNFMNILRYKEWTEKYINENFSILFNDANKNYQPRKLLQIASWVTFHPFEKYDFEKIDVMPDYWPQLHSFLLKQTLNLLKDTLTVIDQNFLKDLKTIQLSLLSECPQCYFALEAEVLNKHFSLFKDMNLNADTDMKISLNIRKVNDHAEIYDRDYMPKLILMSLLNENDISDYSTRLLKVYKKVVEVNNIVSFNELGRSKTFYTDAKRFEEYYTKKKEKFNYWLSPARINDVDKNWYQDKLLSLKN